MKTQNKILALSSLSLLALFSVSVQATSIPDNHCLQRDGSKRYLSKVISFDYPRSATFECLYDCNINGRIETLSGVSKVTVRNMEQDARMMGCQGMRVKKVSWGYEYDGSDAFYIFDTKIKELKDFAFNKVDQDNETELIYLNRLKQTLMTVAKSYQSTGFPFFMEASKTLTMMAQALPQNTQLLDQYINKYVSVKGNLKSEQTSEYLVLSNIVAHAVWRVPN